MTRRLRGLLALPLAVSLSAGCAETSPARARHTLTVLAASSLARVLEPLSVALRASHPGLTIRLVYAGTPSLVAQVRSGAPADVLITASTSALDPLQEAGLVDSPTPIASNTTVLVVPARNPGRVVAVSDLADSRLRLALCDPSVPCGQAAERTLRSAHVRADPDTLAPDVKTVLRLVTSGEADAGIVYASDAQAARGLVHVVALPAGTSASTRYAAAVVSATSRAGLAHEYVTLLAGPRGQAVLRGAGFGPP